MKSRDQVTALLYQHRIAVVAGQHLCVRTDVADDRRADEDRLQVAAFHGSGVRLTIRLSSCRP